jgi:small subunit ribosomal protein S15
MYSRKRGKSGSTKPAERKMPWVKYKPSEVEEIIVKLAKSGKGSAEIGLILRDQYGLPSVRDYSKSRIARILKKNGIETPLPEDMFNLMKRAVMLRNHMSKNTHDYTSKRGLALTESKIRRLAKYYKERKLLQHDWKYDPEKARLLVKS